MVFSILKIKFVAERLPSVGIKLSCWSGIRLQLFMFEFGFYANKISNSVFSNAVAEFGIVALMEHDDFPYIPEIRMVFWDLETTFRMLPKWKLKSRRQLPFSPTKIELAFDDSHTNVNITADVVCGLTEYRNFIGIKKTRRTISLMFVNEVVFGSTLDNRKFKVYQIDGEWKLNSKESLRDCINRIATFPTRKIDPLDSRVKYNMYT